MNGDQVDAKWEVEFWKLVRGVNSGLLGFGILNLSFTLLVELSMVVDVVVELSVVTLVEQKILIRYLTSDSESQLLG